MYSWGCGRTGVMVVTSGEHTSSVGSDPFSSPNRHPNGHLNSVVVTITGRQSKAIHILYAFSLTPQDGSLACRSTLRREEHELFSARNETTTKSTASSANGFVISFSRSSIETLQVFKPALDKSRQGEEKTSHAVKYTSGSLSWRGWMIGHSRVGPGFRVDINILYKLT